MNIKIGLEKASSFIAGVYVATTLIMIYSLSCYSYKLRKERESIESTYPCARPYSSYKRNENEEAEE